MDWWADDLANALDFLCSNDPILCRKVCVVKLPIPCSAFPARCRHVCWAFMLRAELRGKGLIWDLLLLSLLSVPVPYKACRFFGVFPSFRVLLFVPSLSA